MKTVRLGHRRQQNLQSKKPSAFPQYVDFFLFINCEEEIYIYIYMCQKKKKMHFIYIPISIVELLYHHFCGLGFESLQH